MAIYTRLHSIGLLNQSITNQYYCNLNFLHSLSYIRFSPIISDVYQIDVIPGKTYLLRLINAGLNTENFFAIANHNLTIVEADAEYTKPFTTNTVMIGPGQTLNVLVSANQPVGKYSMGVAPYESGRMIIYQNVSAIAYFNYIGTPADSLSLPAKLPKLDDELAVKTVMDGLRSLNRVNVFKEIDKNLFVTIGLNVQKCHSKKPKQNCQFMHNGVMAASMNNISFVDPNISILEAYYKKIKEIYTEDFPDTPPKFYDFVNGAPNNIPYDTQSLNGTRTKVLKYGSRVQVILQDTRIVTTENHPMHFHGYSFYVVGYGTGNYNPLAAQFNLVDPPYMNTIGVPSGGWAAIRFVADNPGTDPSAVFNFSIVLLKQQGIIVFNYYQHETFLQGCGICTATLIYISHGD